MVVPASDESEMARKIKLDKVQASLDAVCPKCGKVISSAEVRRADFVQMECPACGERFTSDGQSEKRELD
jgi:predicted RNA-binding Zn-ribbon protein involved in translation (DUF1610 family)